MLSAKCYYGAVKSSGQYFRSNMIIVTTNSLGNNIKITREMPNSNSKYSKLTEIFNFVKYSRATYAPGYEMNQALAVNQSPGLNFMQFMLLFCHNCSSVFKLCITF